MPLIKVQTSAPPLEQSLLEELLKKLSTSLADHVKKPESYVMTAFESDSIMTFAFSPSWRGTSDYAGQELSYEVITRNTK